MSNNNQLDYTKYKGSKVFFTKDLNNKESLINLYSMLDHTINTDEGKRAFKVHTGEAGNINFIGPDFWAPIILYLDGDVVETNTAYEGARHDTESHMQLLKEHGWTNMFNCKILDSDGDMAIEIPNGKIINRNYIGKYTYDYDSAIVLSHFKGHRMGGFGGAIKQLGIGFASAFGKLNIHGYGNTEIGISNISNVKSANQNAFLEAMVEAASSIIDVFNGKIIYFNVLKNISIDCDCDAEASPPCMKDIGILASTDPVAIDYASFHLVNNSKDNGKQQVITRIIEMNGLHTLEYAESMGLGSRDFILVEI